MPVKSRESYDLSDSRASAHAILAFPSLQSRPDCDIASNIDIDGYTSNENHIGYSRSSPGGGAQTCKARRHDIALAGRTGVTPNPGRERAQIYLPPARRELRWARIAAGCSQCRLGSVAGSRLRRRRSLIAVDTNILVYAHRRDATFHDIAAQCLSGLAEGRAAWAIPWPCVHEFLAIVTHPRIYDPPTTMAAAIDQVAAWLESPSLTLLAESEQHWPNLKSLLESGRIAGGKVHDARVAALCLQHGVRELWSADRDFSRFSQLTLVNPLIR